ncbi:MAG: putative 4-mercaptohistidine N1-methyltransferase, partial [Gammaproteobacteria bacterium]
GFRLVQELETAQSNKYESDELVSQYLLLHWGSPDEQRDAAIAEQSGFPKTGNLVERTVGLMGEFATAHNRALDLGCAVGRASFDLARQFGRVTGVDYSEGFIAAANTLKENSSLPYKRWETGRHFSELEAALAPHHDPSRVSFLEGDATNLDSLDLGKNPFDAVLLCNLMCRLPDPAACLRQFTGGNSYLAPGGVLVIASPNTWMTQYTRPEKFLDGADSDATLTALGEILQGFSLLHSEDFPFMIREHRRKYEYIISQLSVWRKQ